MDINLAGVKKRSNCTTVPRLVHDCSLQPRLMRDNKMSKPLLQASSSPLPPLRMSRCKIQAQRLSIAGSRMRASELKQRFFVHTQQDVILCPGLMVQPFLNTSLPIKNHVTYNCAAGGARGSRSIPGRIKVGR